MSTMLEFNLEELYIIENQLVARYGVSMPIYLNMRMTIQQRIRQLYDLVYDRLPKNEYQSSFHTGTDDDGYVYVEFVISLYSEDSPNEYLMQYTIKLDHEYRITFTIDFTHHHDNKMCFANTQDMIITAYSYHANDCWDRFCKTCMTAVDSIVDVYNSIKQAQ